VIVARVSWNWARWQLPMRRWYVRDTNVRIRKVLCFMFVCLLFLSSITFPIITLLYHPMSSFQNIYLILPNFLVRFLSSLGFIFLVIYHVFEHRENGVAISSIGKKLKVIYVLVFLFSWLPVTFIKWNILCKVCP